MRKPVITTFDSVMDSPVGRKAHHSQQGIPSDPAALFMVMCNTLYQGTLEFNKTLSGQQIAEGNR